MKRYIIIILINLITSLFFTSCQIYNPPVPYVVLNADEYHNTPATDSIYITYNWIDDTEEGVLYLPTYYHGYYFLCTYNGKVICISGDEQDCVIKDIITSNGDWRLPTKKEAEIMRKIDPKWFDHSNKRYVCVNDDGVYYSFKFGGEGNVTKCGETVVYHVRLIKLL